MVPTVALATCQAFPLLDDDDRLLLPALAAVGVDAVPAVWTDPGIDWSAFDAVVIRDTWDYPDDRDAFLAWTERVAATSTLLNPAAVVAWNTDKHYLRDLALAGLPVVPTRFLEPGDEGAAWLPEADVAEVVVKPAVSCGSRDTVRHDVNGDLDIVRAHIDRLLADGRSVMVQPYLDAVDVAGETALVFVGGQFSHAIRKGPMLALGVEGVQISGLFVMEQIDARAARPAELALAADILDAIPGGRDQVLYARIDVIPGADGKPLLLELELTEPSLFLSRADGAPARMATAIADRLQREGRIARG